MGRVERHLAGPYRRCDRDAALRALDQVGLTHLRRRSFADLSGGERQRVLIAQALACDPELLLMDEPTANVDYVVENRLYALLRELNEQLTVIVVSHNLNVVTDTVRHVLCVNRSAELHPASELVAEVFQEQAGTRMAILQHGIRCHVIDPSAVFQAPHSAETAADEGVP